MQYKAVLGRLVRTLAGSRQPSILADHVPVLVPVDVIIDYMIMMLFDY